YLKAVKQANTGQQKSDTEILLQVPRKYLGFDIKLFEKKRRALSANALAQLPRGGGTLDLRSVVTGDTGSFYLQIRVMSAEDLPENQQSLRVFFFSNAPKRKIDEEEYGAGCN